MAATHLACDKHLADHVNTKLEHPELGISLRNYKVAAISSGVLPDDQGGSCTKQ